MERKMIMCLLPEQENITDRHKWFLNEFNYHLKIDRGYLNPDLTKTGDNYTANISLDRTVLSADTDHHTPATLDFLSLKDEENASFLDVFILKQEDGNPLGHLIKKFYTDIFYSEVGILDSVPYEQETFEGRTLYIPSTREIMALYTEKMERERSQQ